MECISLNYRFPVSSLVNMTERFGETLHILWQCAPYALEAVAIIHQPVIYSHRQNHAHTLQTNQIKSNQIKSQ